MNETDKTINKIRQLIALATNNPAEEEARTAAIQACRIIVDGNFRIFPAGYTASAAARGKPSTTAPADERKPRRPGSVFHKNDVEWTAMFASSPSFCPYCRSVVIQDAPVQSSIGFGRYHRECWMRIRPEGVVVPLNQELAEEWYAKTSPVEPVGSQKEDR